MAQPPANLLMLVLIGLALAAWPPPSPAADSPPPLVSGKAPQNLDELWGGKPWQGPREFRNVRWEVRRPQVNAPFAYIRDGQGRLTMRRYGWLVGLLGLLAALPGSRGEAQSRPGKSPSVKSYSTHFQLDEDPISEGGRWINGAKEGVDWYNVITKNGVAYGAVSAGDYTDPTALLTGTWGRNQFVKAKVYSKNQTEKCFQEVEIRLRSTLTAHHCTGYEVFWRCLKTGGAYVEIVRWNGKVKDWSSLQKHSGAPFGVKDGDVVEATIVGHVIKGYLNGVEVITATDKTYTTGNPGMGFNYGVGKTNADFGFSSYEVDSYND